MDYKGLLTQLGYNIDDASIAQMQRILNNLDGVSIKQILELHDHLKSNLCFVAMSSSEDRLKIKNIATIAEIKEKVDQMIFAWANKYKVNIKKINQTTYYILGRVENE